MLNINNEIWTPIPNFEKYYEVSTNGRVRNNRNKIMKTYTNNSGYECIKFSVNNVRTTHLIHRLVAITYINNPNNLPEVNHIDEDKSNNQKLNLEWCTSSNNKRHSMATGTYDAIYTTKNSLGKKHIPSTYSKYHNVSFCKSRNKWSATVRVNGKNMFQKRFDTEIEAAKHVNWIIDKLQLTDRPKNIID